MDRSQQQVLGTLERDLAFANDIELNAMVAADPEKVEIVEEVPAGPAGFKDQDLCDFALDDIGQEALIVWAPWETVAGTGNAVIGVKDKVAFVIAQGGSIGDDGSPLVGRALEVGADP